MGVRDLRRLLFAPANATRSANATRFAAVLNEDGLAFIIIDFVEDWGSDLHWGPDTPR